MDVSIRHWPIFVTGLLLGAAGTMSLGLHRPTQLELAAAMAAAQPAAAPVPAVVVSQAGPEIGNQERAEEQMRAAAEGFRTQEALTAIAAPFFVAAAQPSKPRIRRVPKEVDFDAETSAGSMAAAQAIKTASTPAFEPSVTLRSATSVMGAAPAARVMPARGSAHAPEAGDIFSQPE